MVRERLKAGGEWGDTCKVIPVYRHEVQTRRWPYVTICLVGLNLIIFAFEATVGVRLIPFLQEWGLVPARINAEITGHNLTTVVTSVFLHVSVLHVLSNMWFLYVFGDAVEDALGHWWFLLLYVVAGFFGGMAFIATGPHVPVPAVGASGAISGVMAASLVLWPRARLKVWGVVLLVFIMSLVYEFLVRIGMPSLVLGGPLLFIVGGVASLVFMNRKGQRMGFVAFLISGVSVPSWFVLGLFIGQQLWSGALSLVNPAYGGSVGWWAHIGGFACGVVCTLVFPKHPQTLETRAVV
jgi:membrane associated rhomboid family serine protease